MPANSAPGYHNQHYQLNISGDLSEYVSSYLASESNIHAMFNILLLWPRSADCTCAIIKIVPLFLGPPLNKHLSKTQANYGSIYIGT